MNQKRTATIVGAAVLAAVASAALVGCSSDDGPDRTAAIGATAPATTGYSISDAQVAEGDTRTATGAVTVTRGGPTTAAGSVKVTALAGTATVGTVTDGGDFPALTKTVSFAAGSKSVRLEVPVFGDTLTEPDETVNLVLSNPVGAKIANGVGVLTITNDDKGAMTDGFVAGNISVSENSGTVVVPVFRYGSTKYAASVDVAVSSTSAYRCARSTDAPKGVCDFGGLSKTLVFAAGASVATVTVPVYTDSGNPEADEVIDVKLANASDKSPYASEGALLTTTDGTITLVSATTPASGFSIGDAAVTEGQSGKKTMSFTIVRTGSLESSASLTWSTAPGTATAADFTAVSKQSVAFQRGEASKTVTVDVVGEAGVEPNETFTVTLSGPRAPAVVDGSATGMIVNDD